MKSEEWRVRSEKDAVDYEKKESAVDEESKIEFWREKQKAVDDGKKKESIAVVNEEVVVSCRSHGGWLIEKEIRPYCFRVNVICVLLLATG